jgi:hypothetical protein
VPCTRMASTHTASLFQLPKIRDEVNNFYFVWDLEEMIDGDNVLCLTLVPFGFHE